MKKLISMLLVLTMAVSLFAACGKNEEPATEPAPETAETTGATEEVTTEATEEVTEPQASASPALTVLENIWAKYGDDEKFAVMGGNIESAVMDAPGVFDLAYPDGLTYNLLVPADQIPNVAGAASMIHAMNANTFTCGVFQLAEGVSAQDFAAAMNGAIAGNMWMCGFPERQVIASFEDGCVLVAFGVGDAMTPFFTHLQEAYPEANILFDEPIA